MTAPVLALEDVHKSYKVTDRSSRTLRKSLVRAVDGVSLDVRPAEIVALVGESGCGKSSLARLALALTTPDAGRVYFDGQDIGELSRAALRREFRSQVQAVFQDPAGSLNPRRTVGEIVAGPLLLHGKASRQSVTQRVRELLEAQGLTPAPVFESRRPGQLSGGQQQRVAIARALGVEPKVIIADEPVSALDVSVRAQVLEKLKRAQETQGVACLLITHDMGVVRAIADRVAVMYLGRVVEIGRTDRVMSDPRHPYTRMLLDAVPRVSTTAADRVRSRPVGEPPNAAQVPTGCRFRSRCALAQDWCADLDPGLTRLVDGREVACPVVTDGQLPVLRSSGAGEP